MLGIIVGIALVLLVCGLTNSIKPALLTAGIVLVLAGLNGVQSGGSVFVIVLSVGALFIGAIFLIALFK